MESLLAVSLIDDACPKMQLSAYPAWPEHAKTHFPGALNDQDDAAPVRETGIAVPAERKCRISGENNFERYRERKYSIDILRSDGVTITKITVAASYPAPFLP
jgi:hypothetical protein